MGFIMLTKERIQQIRESPKNKTEELIQQLYSQGGATKIENFVRSTGIDRNKLINFYIRRTPYLHYDVSSKIVSIMRRPTFDQAQMALKLQVSDPFSSSSLGGFLNSMFFKAGGCVSYEAMCILVQQYNGTTLAKSTYNDHKKYVKQWLIALDKI